MSYLLLTILWAAWCVIHSLMISQVIVSGIKDRYGGHYRYYRIFFNLASLLTLIPVMIYSNLLRGDLVFTWSGVWRPVQITLLMGALAFFYGGTRHYDLKQFLGIRQAMGQESRKGLTRTGELDTTGILGAVRHPWYAGGFFILWARPFDKAGIVTNFVLTAYLVLGTVLEERKLTVEFGDEYREYQKRVPMFFPWEKIRKFKG